MLDHPCVVCNQFPCECWRLAQEAEDNDTIAYLLARHLAGIKRRRAHVDAMLDRMLDQDGNEVDA